MARDRFDEENRQWKIHGPCSHDARYAGQINPWCRECQKAVDLATSLAMLEESLG